MPNVPTITLEGKYFKIEAIKVPENMNVLYVLKVINESVLKSSWKPSFKASGKEYHTWLLGLPRSQRKTGYIVIVHDESEKENEAFRRKSSIGINIFESAKNVKFIIIHGFLSKDWPLSIFDKKYSLKWCSNRTSENVEDIMCIQKKSVEAIFEEVFNEVRDRIEKKLSEKR